MSDTLFSVVLDGVVLDGFDPQETQERLANLFKIQPHVAATMLGGKSMTVKNGVNKATAEKYLEALEAAGAKCHFKEFESLSATPSISPVANDQTVEEKASENIEPIESPPSLLSKNTPDDISPVLPWFPRVLNNHRGALVRWVLPVLAVLFVSFLLRTHAFSHISDVLTRSKDATVTASSLAEAAKDCNQSDFPRPITFENTQIPNGLPIKKSVLCELGNVLYDRIRTDITLYQQSRLNDMCGPAYEMIKIAGSADAALERLWAMTNDPNAKIAEKYIYLCRLDSVGEKIRAAELKAIIDGTTPGVYSVGSITSPKSKKKCVAFLSSLINPKTTSKLYDLNIINCDSDIGAINNPKDILKIYKYTGVLPQYYEFRGEKMPFIKEYPVEVAAKKQAGLISKAYCDPSIPANQITQDNLGASIEKMLARTLKVSKLDFKYKLKSLKVIDQPEEISPETMNTYLFKQPVSVFGFLVKGVNLQSLAGAWFEIEFILNRPAAEEGAVQNILEELNLNEPGIRAKASGPLPDDPAYTAIGFNPEMLEDLLPSPLNELLVNSVIDPLTSMHGTQNHPPKDIKKVIFAELDANPETQDAVTAWCNIGPSSQSVECFLTLVTKTLSGPGFSGLDKSNDTKLDSQLDTMEVKDGIVTVHTKKYGDTDAACCPSIKATNLYRFIGGEFVDILKPRSLLDIMKSMPTKVAQSDSTPQSTPQADEAKQHVTIKQAKPVIRSPKEEAFISMYSLSTTIDGMDGSTNPRCRAFAQSLYKQLDGIEKHFNNAEITESRFGDDRGIYMQVIQRSQNIDRVIRDLGCK